MNRSKSVVYFFVGMIVLSVGLIFFYILTYYPLKYKQEIILYSQEFNLPPELVASVINTESGFNKNAISKAGAIGLMQLLPSSAKDMATKLELKNYKTEDLFEPDINIRLGCCYLNYLINRFNNIDTAIYAYNAGPKRVQDWLKNEDYSIDSTTLLATPYPETNIYLERVKKGARIYCNFF